MADLIPIPIPNFDPLSAISSPSRAVEGVLIARPVVLDVFHAQYARWLKVATTGTVSYIGWDGVQVDDPVISAGVWHPIYSIKVLNSGTSATGVMWGN